MDRAFPEDATGTSREDVPDGENSGTILPRIRRLLDGVADRALGWLASRLEASRSRSDRNYPPDTTEPMTTSRRRGTCTRCGLEFDAGRGYSVLDVFDRAAEDPRKQSSERTIRLCDVCAEDFREFVDLGRGSVGGSDDAVPGYLRSR